jgi:hypothetical protein
MKNILIFSLLLSLGAHAEFVQKVYSEKSDLVYYIPSDQHMIQPLGVAIEKPTVVEVEKLDDLNKVSEVSEVSEVNEFNGFYKIKSTPTQEEAPGIFDKITSKVGGFFTNIFN